MITDGLVSLNSRKQVKVRLAKMFADGLRQDQDTGILNERLSLPEDVGIRIHYQPGDTFLHLFVYDQKQSGPVTFEVQLKEVH